MQTSLAMKLLTATAAVLAVLSTEPAEAGEKSCGRLPQTDVAWAGPGFSQNVNSQTFVDVQGSSTTFTVGGSGNSCVIMSVNVLGTVFSDAPSGQSLRVDALIDGNIPNVDGGAVVIQTPQFAFPGTGNFPASYSWDFIFPNVSPGQHTVELRAAVSFPNATQGGPESTIVGYTMDIRHR